MASALSEFKQATILNTLRHCRLFSGPWGAANLNDIAGITVVKWLAKRDYLFREGMPVRGFYIVQRGAIKLHRHHFTGKEQVIHIFRPNESFAEESLVSNLGYPADACAVEDSQVLMVQKSEFLALVRRRPELVLCLLRSLDQHLQILVGLLDDLTLKDVKTRLAAWLLQRCANPESDEPHRIELPMTKRLLASELGTTSETFSRTLAKFRKQQLLSVEGKTVTLLCPSKLVQFVRDNVGFYPVAQAI